MAMFHVNGNGEAGACRASKGECPFGGQDRHFTSAEAAREFYESSMTGKNLAVVTVAAVDREFRIDQRNFELQGANYDLVLEAARKSKAEGQFMVIASKFVDEKEPGYAELPPTWDKNRYGYAVYESATEGEAKFRDDVAQWERTHPKTQTVKDFESSAVGTVIHLMVVYRDEKHFQSEIESNTLPPFIAGDKRTFKLDRRQTSNGFYATKPTARKDQGKPTYFELRVV